MLLRNQSTNNQPGLLKVPAQKTSTSALRSNNPPIAELGRSEQTSHPHCRYCGTRGRCVFRIRIGICEDRLPDLFWQDNLHNEGYLTKMEANR
jgi:hypothetical protein